MGSFSQPGVTGNWNVDVHWGDGSADTTFSVNGQGSLGTQTHTYSATGMDTVTMTVTDPFGNTGSDTFTVTVAAPPVKLGPGALPPDTIDVAYNQAITASGGAGDITLVVSNVQNAIAGLSVPGSGTNTNAITGTPTARGTETFTITATDQAGATAQTNYSITVNPAVTLSQNSLPADTINVSYNQTITASGGTGNINLVVSNLQNAIAGLTVSGGGANAIAITGKPTATGTETFTVTATDQAGGTTQTNFSITVNSAVTLSPSSLPGGTANVAYNQTITASGGTGDISLVVSDMQNAIAGLNVPSSGTNTLVITGLPTATGTETFTVTATDQAGGTTQTSFSIAIAAAPPSKISGTVFSDHDSSGVLEAGDIGLAGQSVYLDLNNSGQLEAGDPSTVTAADGSFQFTGLAPGTYTVRQLLLGGVLLSTPTSGSLSVTIGSQTSFTNQNFGDVRTSITVPLTLPPATSFPAQGNPNGDCVEAIFRAILDRNADAGGLTYWTGALNSGSFSRVQVVQGIRNSPEHFTQEVDALYQTLLSRTADASGQAYWVGQLEGGLPEEQMAFSFLNSPEYLGKGDKFFVDSMYLSLLGRSFDSTGEAFWLSQLGDDATGNPTGSPAALTHAQVVTDFLYSTESLQRLVGGYYTVFLQRQADTGGLNSWVAELQQGVPFLTIGEEFVASDEFYNNAAGNN